MDAYLRAGPLELDLSARRLWLAGQPRDIEPRPFGVLAQLARTPGQVVDKNTLLAIAWASRPVSDTALARAVMKVRRAIAGDTVQAQVRTVARIGYRLEVPHEAPPLPGPPAAAPALVVLPFKNLTQDPNLAWLEFGLMSFVQRALGNDRRVHVVQIDAVLATVKEAAAQGVDAAAATRSAFAQALQVQGTLVRQGPGFELRLGLVGGFQTAVHADHPDHLGPRAAVAIRALLFGDAAPSVPELHAGDPLATTSFARGLFALGQHQYDQAANLFRLALMLAPGSRRVRLELLYALSKSGRVAAAQELAQSLLADAERDADGQSAAQCHLALAVSHMYQADHRQALVHVKQILRLADPAIRPLELAKAHMLAAQIAAHGRDHEAMENALEQMREPCERCADPVLQTRRLNMLAVAAVARRDYPQAIELSRQTAEAAQRRFAYREAVAAHGNAAWQLTLLGRWAEAAAHAEQAFALAGVSRQSVSLCIACFQGAWVYANLGVPAAAQRLVQALPEVDPLSAMEQVWAQLARALAATAAGAHGLAARLYQETLQRIRSHNDRYYETPVRPLYVRALVHCGRLAEARAELGADGQGPWSAEHDPQGELAHCHAQLLYCEGRLAPCLAQLEQLAAAPVAALILARALLDAAWLHADAGHPGQAQQLLERVPADCRQMPLWSAVAARVSARGGHQAQAHTQYQHFLATTNGALGHPGLAQSGAVIGHEGRPPPPSSHLPSLL